MRLLRDTFIPLILLAGIAGISSCITTSPVCLTSSNTPLNNKSIIENFGRVEGKSDFFSFQGSSILGLYMIGKPDIQQAIDNALAVHNADALINIKCYENNYWFIIWGKTTVTIEGEAVKLVNKVQ